MCTIASVGDGQGGVHQEVRQVQPHPAAVRRGHLQVLGAHYQ